MGRGRKKTSNKSTPFLNLKGLKTKSYDPENYEGVNPEDLSDDEIDAFIKANEDKVSLRGTKGFNDEDDEDENRGLGYDNDLVMPLSEDDDVSDDDNNDDIDMAAIDAVNRRRARERANGGGNGGDDDDDDDEAPEDEEEMIEKEQAIGGWGHNKASYYEEHSSARSGASMPSQASRNEELEARRLQRAHNSAIDEEDFAGSMTSDVTSSAAAAEEGDKKKSGHENFTVEREMVEEISKDLNDISIVPGQQQKGGMEEIEKKLDGLTNEEKLNIIAQNSPELIALIGEFKSSLALVKSSYAPAMKKIAVLDADALPADLARLCTFVKTKFHLLMQYCLNISFYLMLKSQEKGVKDHPVIEELVRIRTLFEKLNPIELKLKPKLNKLFKNVSDPSFSLTSLYKSTAAAVAADEEKEEEIEEGEGEEEGDGSGVDLGFDLEAMVGQKEPKAKKSSSKKPSIKSFVAKKYSSGSRSSAVKAGSGKLVDETGEREEYYANSDDEEKATFDVDKKRALTQTINDIAQVSHESGQLRRKRMLSGDQDFLPQQAKQNKKQKVDISAFAKMGAGSDGEEEEEAEKEEERKGPSKSSLKGRRRREKARIEKGLKILAEDNLEEGAKRDISRRIEKNRGLIRSRSSAHGTTPHSRVRAKFQKKLRSGSGVMPAKRDNSKPFTGEKNGIKPYIVRSTKF